MANVETGDETPEPPVVKDWSQAIPLGRELRTYVSTHRNSDL